MFVLDDYVGDGIMQYTNAIVGPECVCPSLYAVECRYNAVQNTQILHK